MRGRSAVFYTDVASRIFGSHWTCVLSYLYKLLRGGGGTLLNPLKIKPPIADFLYPPRGFKGVKSPKNLAPFDFLRQKVPMQKVALKTVLLIWEKCEKIKQKWYHLRKCENFVTNKVPIEECAKIRQQKI